MATKQFFSHKLRNREQLLKILQDTQTSELKLGNFFNLSRDNYEKSSS